MKSIFVYARTLPDARVVVAIGEGKTPEASYVLGTFRTLEDAKAFRDRKRLELRFGALDIPNPRPRVKRAAAGFLNAITGHPVASR